MLERLIDREARADRRDLEQDAGRLAEVDRAEVVAVDDRRRTGPCLNDARMPLLVFFGRAGPRDMMDGPRALDRVRDRWRVV